MMFLFIIPHFYLILTIRVHNWFISKRKKIHMEKAMMIKINMYHSSDSIICKHNVYGISISDWVYSHFWHEVHTESNIHVQSLYATHVSIPSLLSFNRVENWKKNITFRPFNHFPTIILYPMTRNHVKFDKFVLQEKKIHNNDNKKKIKPKKLKQMWVCSNL